MENKNIVMLSLSCYTQLVSASANAYLNLIENSLNHCFRRHWVRVCPFQYDTAETVAG